MPFNYHTHTRFYEDDEWSLHSVFNTEIQAKTSGESDSYYSWCVRRVDVDTYEEVTLYEKPRGSRNGWVVLHVEPLEKDKEGKLMIKAAIGREKGKLVLMVDAKDFHETLDSIGCSHANGVYENRPTSSFTVANTAFQMSTECLLRREYPAKFDLSGIWGNIPTHGQLTQLCESAYAAGRKILDHYQPIDISIEIQKKIIK